MLLTLVLLSDPANLTSEVQHRRSRVPTSAERAATGRVHNGHLEPKNNEAKLQQGFRAPTVGVAQRSDDAIDFLFKLAPKIRRI